MSRIARIKEVVHSRIAREQAVLAWMIRRHCARVHLPPRSPCPACAQLTEAALARLAGCPHGDQKPSCTQCEIRCFSPDELAGVREVMRAAGPGFSTFRVVLLGMKTLDRFRGLT